ncbi:MAG: lactonase family protein [Chloroflexi bacterium]|nr:lactonase family protein [Chloroflexota bacterium]
MAPPGSLNNLVYVGTYTRSNRSEGIYVFDFDPATGKLSQRSVTPEMDPSFLAFDPTGRYLFAVSEGFGLDGGEAASFAIDQHSGALTPLNRQKTGGGEPCHLTTDSTGRWLLVANHEHGSVAVFPIEENGRLKERSDLRQHHGSGPGPTQQGPHAHFVTFDPEKRRVLVNDKGIDHVVLYRLNTQRGVLEPNDPPFGQVHSGAAPRHLSFLNNGRYVYVNGEADMTLNVLSYDASTGQMRELQSLSTLPAGASRDRVSTAQVLVEPAGRYVYVSNRGDDSIACFAIDASTGHIEARGHVSTQGKTPRTFAIDPTGKWLYAANQNSGTIVQFEITAATGELVPTGQVTQVGAPVCILFR